MNDHHTAGTTLIELMVALLVGSLVIAGTLTLYQQGARMQRIAEIRAELLEQAVFALDGLTEPLRLAGHTGLHRVREPIPIPADIAVPCRVTGIDAAAFALALHVPVAAFESTDALPCPTRDPRPDTHVLVARHVEPAAVSPLAGQVQLQAGLEDARLFANGSAPLADPAARIHDVRFEAWYVSSHSGFGSELPSLRHLTLTGNGRIEDREVIPGVETLRVRLGIDTNGDGAVDRYVEPGESTPTEAVVRAVRLWLLLRTGRLEPGFDDQPHAVHGDGSRWIHPGTDDGFPPGYRRLAVTRTILLRNARR